MTVGQALEQALVLQLQKRLPHRNAGHRQCLRNIFLCQLLAVRYPAGGDFPPQQSRDAVFQTQALLLNGQKTQFNIALGLCVGHDALFCKYSDALVTTLAAKDRARRP